MFTIRTRFRGSANVAKSAGLRPVRCELLSVRLMNIFRVRAPTPKAFFFPLLIPPTLSCFPTAYK